jgi:hypothetical protein
LKFFHEEDLDKALSRAKSAKDAKVDFDKKSEGRGLCELRVLGARKFLAVVLLNISEVGI